MSKFDKLYEAMKLDSDSAKLKYVLEELDHMREGIVYDSSYNTDHVQMKIEDIFKSIGWDWKKGKWK